MNSKEKKIFEEIEDHLNEFMSNMCQLYEVQHFKNPEKKIFNTYTVLQNIQQILTI